MNSVSLIGRATREPESRKTNSGTNVAVFTVAVDGFNDSTSFINCVAYGKIADVIVNCVRKGSLIGVAGKLNQRTYEASEGSKRSVVEVIADNIDLLEKKPEEVVNNEEKPTKKTKKN